MARKKKIKIPKEYGYCHVSVVPMRKRPQDDAEMVSQLLFGETISVLAIKNKSWVQVRSDHDGYKGWIDPKMITWVTEEDHEKYQTNVSVCLDLVGNLINNDVSFPILMGASFANYDGISFKTPMGKYVFNGQAVLAHATDKKIDILLRMARKYLHAPYLWGGRSPFGIDCSGLTQVLYKMIGVSLPRDASDQATYGEIVDFVELTQPGDLAYFVNGEGRIIHVGMILQERSIIHASGQVRIDTLDHEGIFNADTKKYSHRLKFIKRILPAYTSLVSEEE